MTCSPTEDSDQSVHLHSRVEIFFIYMNKNRHMAIKTSCSENGSNNAHKQPDRGLRQVHMQLVNVPLSVLHHRNGDVCLF